MTVLSTIPNGALGLDVRDTINHLIVTVADLWDRASVLGNVTTPNGLDVNIPVPKMTVHGSPTVFPPIFDVVIPVEAQADNVKYRIERYVLSAVTVLAQSYTGIITDAMVNANAISGLFTDITVSCLYRMRLETSDGTRWGNWSNSIIHGSI